MSGLIICSRVRIVAEALEKRRIGDVAASRERASRILGEAEISPNYQRLLDMGDARDVGERDLHLILAEQSRPALAERHRAAAARAVRPSAPAHPALGITEAPARARKRKPPSGGEL